MSKRPQEVDTCYFCFFRLVEMVQDTLLRWCIMVLSMGICRYQFHVLKQMCVERSLVDLQFTLIVLVLS